jgi:hypothetical protein
MAKSTKSTKTAVAAKKTASKKSAIKPASARASKSNGKSRV